jgi:hypothetical protein
LGIALVEDLEEFEGGGRDREEILEAADDAVSRQHW